MSSRTGACLLHFVLCFQIYPWVPLAMNTFKEASSRFLFLSFCLFLEAFQLQRAANSLGILVSTLTWHLIRWLFLYVSCHGEKTEPVRLYFVRFDCVCNSLSWGPSSFDFLLWRPLGWFCFLSGHILSKSSFLGWLFKSYFPSEADLQVQFLPFRPGRPHKF